MKVIIAGSRGVPAHVADPLIREAAAAWEAEHGPITEVVSGAEPSGVDARGEAWAHARQIPVKAFPYRADLGRRGGPVRNSDMAAYAGGLILIHAGTRGSADMLRKARAQAARRAFPIIEREIP